MGIGNMDCEDASHKGSCGSGRPGRFGLGTMGGEETETEFSIPGQEEQVSRDTLGDAIHASANSHGNVNSVHWSQLKVVDQVLYIIFERQSLAWVHTTILYFHHISVLPSGRRSVTRKVIFIRSCEGLLENVQLSPNGRILDYPPLVRHRSNGAFCVYILLHLA
jgi:hypothetical protein